MTVSRFNLPSPLSVRKSPSSHPPPLTTPTPADKKFSPLKYCYPCFGVICAVILFMLLRERHVIWDNLPFGKPRSLSGHRKKQTTPAIFENDPYYTPIHKLGQGDEGV